MYTITSYQFGLHVSRHKRFVSAASRASFYTSPSMYTLSALQTFLVSVSNCIMCSESQSFSFYISFTMPDRTTAFWRWSLTPGKNFLQFPSVLHFHIIPSVPCAYKTAPVLSRLSLKTNFESVICSFFGFDASCQRVICCTPSISVPMAHFHSASRFPFNPSLAACSWSFLALCREFIYMCLDGFLSFNGYPLAVSDFSFPIHRSHLRTDSLRHYPFPRKYLCPAKRQIPQVFCWGSFRRLLFEIQHKTWLVSLRALIPFV